MPDGLRAAEETASIVGFAIDIGADAYADNDRFPNGPFCKKEIL